MYFSNVLFSSISSPSLSPVDAGSLASIENPNTSYMQAIVRRVMSNLKVICNNVILKIIEEDTVLSVNIKTIQCISVDERWLPAFIGNNFIGKKKNYSS